VVKKEIVTGTLVGVRDGPFIVIELNGREKKFPLHYALTVNWVYSHMGKRIMCVVEDGKVIEVA
jgi:hypothetical protein